MQIAQVAPRNQYIQLANRMISRYFADRAMKCIVFKPDYRLLIEMIETRIFNWITGLSLFARNHCVYAADC